MTKRLSFPKPRDWPRSDSAAGLARGWQGSAWCWLVLRENGLISPDLKIERAIRLRLKNQFNRKISQYCSPMFGEGANAVVAARLGDDELLGKHLKRWEKVCRGDENLDISLGASGALLGACEIEKVRPGRVDIRLVHYLFERILDDLTRALPRTVDGRIYIGFSHGITGKLFALEAAVHRFGLKHIPSTLSKQVLETLNRERIDIDQGSIWPLMSTSPEIHLQAWCHGGPGIALGLLRLNEISGKKNFLPLAKRAFEGTALVPGGGNNTFCCGALGRAHILLDAYRAFGDRRWLRLAKRSFSHVTVIRYNNVFKKSFHYGDLAKVYFYYRLKNPSLPIPGAEF